MGAHSLNVRAITLVQWGQEHKLWGVSGRLRVMEDREAECSLVWIFDINCC